MAADTILIAEDAPVDALVLRNILAHAGYHTLTANHGRHALEVLEAHPEISLVLADVGMPEMGGVELVTTMRERPEWRRLPVVFVSGAADAATVRAAVSVRPAGYILKPVTEPSRVLERIQGALADEMPVLDDEDVVRARTGMDGAAYRAACRELASWVRGELGDADEGAPRSAVPDPLALARSVGARRLARVLGDGDGPERPLERELRAVLNVLQAAGH